MKKCLSFFLALVMVLSIFTFPAYAAEADATPYTNVCPSCGSRLASRFYDDLLDTYPVPRCTQSSKVHNHYNIYDQRDWFCANNSCDQIGYVIRDEVSYVEYGVCELIRPIG